MNSARNVVQILTLYGCVLHQIHLSDIELKFNLNKNLIGESEVDHQDSPGISQSTNKTLSEVGQERPPIISTVNSFRERQRRMLRKQNTIADLSCRNQVTNSNQDYGKFDSNKIVFLKDAFNKVIN
ncbi:unnamed protein product [Trichobilharzia regenti]|nr:unnamed protein product [Trichobilharzia regenti]